jgi:uncharacterized membrane protein
MAGKVSVRTSTRQLRQSPETVLSARRALIALGAGGLAGCVVGILTEPALAPVAAWVAATLVVLVWVWRIIWPQDDEGTKRLAEAESQSRTTDSAVLVAAVASLAAVVLALVQFSGGQDTAATASVLLSVLSVILSWTLVNTVFALKYARLYYVDDDGGLEFGQEEPPAYSDFAYHAFTVGMAFSGPEGAEPTSARVRKVVLGHALLSYALGTGILAVAINLVTNLGQS